MSRSPLGQRYGSNCSVCKSCREKFARIVQQKQSPNGRRLRPAQVELYDKCVAVGMVEARVYFEAITDTRLRHHPYGPYRATNYCGVCDHDQYLKDFATYPIVPFPSDDDYKDPESQIQLFDDDFLLNVGLYASKVDEPEPLPTCAEVFGDDVVVDEVVNGHEQKTRDVELDVLDISLLEDDDVEDNNVESDNICNMRVSVAI